MQPRALKGLLIEDDPEDTLLLMQLLSGKEWPSFKFGFACAETLEAGLKLLKGESFDVIVLDLMLPDCRGIDTVARVRAAAPEIPLVVLTGLRDEALGLEAMEHGAQDYQVKGSLAGGELKRAISHAVERQRLITNMRNVIEGAPDGMVIVDSAGLVRYANAAAVELLKARGGLQLGRACPFKLPSGLHGELLLAGGERGERTVELRVSEIEWKDRPARLVALRDLTDLRQVERLKAEVQENRRTDRQKDALMSAVSHEMRTPLTVIKAVACQLRDDLAVSDPGRHAELVRLQLGNALRLEKIVSNILDLSRLESGKAEIRAQRVDAQALLKDAAAAFGLVGREKGLEVALELPAALPGVLGDAELIEQVVANLIDNALRYARQRVVVRAEALADGIRFGVIDDGPGIPECRARELFTKFVQLQRTDKPGYHGTGLGLAICKEIVERLGGRIWVESAEGRGARFQFTLPRFGSAPARAAGGAPSPA